MLFNTLSFILFFTILYMVYRLLPHKKQNTLLLIASYFFYSCWDWRFSGLLITSTVVDFFCSIELEKSSSERKRKLLLFTSLSVNLGVLFFFKYCNFFIDSLTQTLEFFGVQANSYSLKVILPVGISFYTFQTLSYTIDVYLKRIKPEKSFSAFALFVSFFPQLVAGPIEKASNLLPQIKNKRVITKEYIYDGIWLIAYGYLLKVFCADNLSSSVNLIFNGGSEFSPIAAIFSIISFAFQIFGDFAGYSSIAIGVSKLMGFSLQTNFKFPYFVTNPSDFWRNWHISLSGWLRDYLYIPLGGNRKGRGKTYRNLMITMLIGGLWHGAAWNFVLWGLYHGTLLSLYRFYREKNPMGGGMSFSKILFMFTLTCFGWLIFRVTSVGQLKDMLLHIFTTPWVFDQTSVTLGIRLLVFSLPIVAIQLLQWKYKSATTIRVLPSRARYALLTFCYLAVILFGEFNSQQFIYFQF